MMAERIRRRLAPFSRAAGGYSLSIRPGGLLLGFLLIALGLCMPALLTEGDLGIYAALRAALNGHDHLELLRAAVLLLALNCLRSAPHYVGLLMLMEACTIKKGGADLVVFKYVLAFFLLVGLYRLIDVFYGIQYVVEFPALIVLLCMSALNRFPVNGLSKATLIVLFVLTIQSMDVMPGLTAWGFGRGEISMDIKTSAMILGCESLLRGFCVMIFLMFAMPTLTTGLLIREKRQMRLAIEKEERMMVQLLDTRIKALEMRDTFEMQSLVHDLKSPLTAIQGLASLSQAVSTDPRLAEYLRRISGASERMSNMISEILYEDYRQPMRVGELIEQARAQFSVDDAAQLLACADAAAERVIQVNAVRMVRAIINVLDNAARAVGGDGEIRLWTEVRKPCVAVCVRDNGKGIRSESLKHIWDMGFSDEYSTGLGLSFVRQTLKRHGGEVRIFSEEGKFTQVELLIPEAKGDGQENSHHR